MRIQLAFAVLALAAATPRAAGADEGFTVVVHPSVQVQQVSTEQLSRLFLKKETRWPDGQAVAPVEPGDGPARSAFAARVHRKSLGAIRSYWNQMIFGGRDVPPLERATDAAVVEYVRDHPGAIGYVAPGAATAGVRVVPVR